MSAAPAAPNTARVSTLELFFDLVFVFTITQVTVRVAAAHAAGDYLAAFLILAVTWWIYEGYAWLTGNMGTASAASRLLLLGGMGGFLVMALSVPQAFWRDGIAFGLAYLLVIGIHPTPLTRAPDNSPRLVLSNGLFNVGVALLVAMLAVEARRA